MKFIVSVVDKDDALCHARIQRVGSLPPVMEAGASYVLGSEKVQVGGAVIFVLDVVQFLKT
jgi:uncharacterized protein YaaQ